MSISPPWLKSGHNDVYSFAGDVGLNLACQRVLEKRGLNGTPLRREKGGVYLFVVLCDNGKAVSKVVQQNEEGTTVAAEDCGSKEVERLVLCIGVVYKRSGKYTTDYASKCQESRASTEQRPRSESFGVSLSDKRVV